jgi:hypothetical protein
VPSVAESWWYSAAPNQIPAAAGDRLKRGPGGRGNCRRPGQPRRPASTTASSSRTSSSTRRTPGRTTRCDAPRSNGSPIRRDARRHADLCAVVRDALLTIAQNDGQRPARRGVDHQGVDPPVQLGDGAVLVARDDAAATRTSCARAVAVAPPIFPAASAFVAASSTLIWPRWSSAPPRRWRPCRSTSARCLPPGDATGLRDGTRLLRFAVHETAPIGASWNRDRCPYRSSAAHRSCRCDDVAPD